MFHPSLPEAWVDCADRSYMSTRLLWFCRFLIDAPIHAHRTIELYFKSFLVSKGVVIKKGKSGWGHEIDILRKQCEKFNNDFSHPEFSRRIKYFQRYFDLVRYPTDIEDKLQDGTVIWFGLDALPVLDEIVAYIRPRVELSEEEWKHTQIYSINYSKMSEEFTMQHRALVDHNEHLTTIACKKSSDAKIDFKDDFELDLPGC